MPKNDWGNREQTKIRGGNKGAINLLSRNREHRKRLRLHIIYFFIFIVVFFRQSFNVNIMLSFD